MSNDTAIKDIRKKIYSMILPITMENVLQTMAGLITAGMVGRIDTVAVGAQGLSVRITQIIWAFFKGITTGATVFVAQAYGAGDLEKIKKVVLNTLFSALVLVVCLQQFIFWDAPGLLAIFNPPRNLADTALVYLRIVSWGLPFLVIMLVVAGVLQGMGNAKTPMRIAVLMNIVNITFGYILIFGGLGISPSGITGAAYALVIAQFVGASIGLYILFNKKGVLGSVFNHSLRIDMKQVLEIYRVGIPSSMESVFWQFAAIILTIIMLTFGETAFAAYQLGLQAESISYTPAMGFGVAATTFIGHSLGAKNKLLGKIYLKELIKGSFIVTVVTAGILVFLPNTLIGLLTYDQEVIKLGAVYLFLMGLVQIPQNVSGVLSGALRGAGFTKVPMLVAGIGLWGIRIPISFILVNFFHYGIVTIWVVMCVDLVFRFILSFILFKSKNIYEQELVYLKGKTKQTNAL
jgi:putative MATE family efflux protein